MSKQVAPWWKGVDIEGDNIQISIGDGPQNVAVGKNVTQVITQRLGAPMPSDRKIIEQALIEFREALDSLQLSESKRAVADYNVELLERELTKTDEQPQGSIVQQAGNWLLDNIPAIVEALVSLFSTPAVGKVIAKAGDTTIKWVKQRLGQDATK